MNSMKKDIRRQSASLFPAFMTASLLGFGCSAPTGEEPKVSHAAETTLGGEGGGQVRQLGADILLYGRQHFWRRATPLVDDRGSLVSIRTGERNPISMEIEESESSHAVAFDLKSITGLHANHFYIQGEASNGDIVIQEWSVPRVAGAYYSDRTLATSPIGVPWPASATEYKIWGSYESPGDRFPDGASRSEIERLKRARLPVRSPIYRGSGIGDVTCWAADPDGRFLIVYSQGDGVLYRLAADGSETLSVEATVTSLPALDGAMSLSAMSFPGQGRGFRLVSEGGGGVQIFLWDSDNDGLTDSTEVLPIAQSVLTYPGLDFVEP